MLLLLQLFLPSVDQYTPKHRELGHVESDYLLCVNNIHYNATFQHLRKTCLNGETR